MKECPKCEVVSPDNAERCDCGYVFAAGVTQSSNLATKRAIRAVVKGVAGIAAVVWFLAPITRYPGPLVFVIATAVLFACFVGLRLLDDDAENGWWLKKRGPNK
jgi:hypothetical protein